MLKHSAWLFIFCLASKDLERLLSLSTNIDWHTIIHVYSQSPEKVMIFSFVLIFSSPWLPLLEPTFPPITPHQKEKKPVKIQVYEVLCSPSYLLSLIFMSVIIKGICILETAYLFSVQQMAVENEQALSLIMNLLSFHFHLSVFVCGGGWQGRVKFF